MVFVVGIALSQCGFFAKEYTLLWRYFGGRQTDTIVGHVVHGVVTSEERVTQEDVLSISGLNANHASLDISLSHFNNVVFRMHFDPVPIHHKEDALKFYPVFTAYLVNTHYLYVLLPSKETSEKVRCD